MKILIAGDYCPCLRVAKCFENEDFETVFGEIKPVVAEVDYSIVNLEAPVVERTAQPIVKCGPNLKCSKNGLKAAKWTGINCVSLANNHFLDYGETGVRDTIENCHAFGLDFVGGGMNIIEASHVLYKDVAGQKLAVINCCEHEFSIATENTGGSNPLNPIQQYYSIRETRDNADIVLVITHGGNENYQLPSPRMVETYRFFIDAGADAVINHHQHCYSGYEIYHGKPIFYGLGNFCFDDRIERNTLWNEGYMVILDYENNSFGFEIIPYNQCNEYPTVKILEQGAFDEKIKELNETIANNKRLLQSINDYYLKNASSCESIFEPIRNRVFSMAKYYGLFPSLISKKRILLAKNMLSCESHHDRLKWWADSFIKK